MAPESPKKSPLNKHERPLRACVCVFFFFYTSIVQNLIFPMRRKHFKKESEKKNKPWMQREHFFHLAANTFHPVAMARGQTVGTKWMGHG